LSQLSLAPDVFIIQDEMWERAKRALERHYQRSDKLEICENLIRDFELTNPKKKYKSDFDVFIRESKLEDFYGNGSETICVSTMHKAKGKEFDNIILMLDGFEPNTDESKRLLYVAMTRAKQNLTIHHNTKMMDSIQSVENMEQYIDSGTYEQPSEISMHLTHKDVWLDYFISNQYYINQLMSGDSLIISEDGCTNTKGKQILKFSRNFIKEIEELKLKNYVLKSAEVNFVIYWQKEGTDEEVKIILPILNFEKTVEPQSHN
jgi:ATP-dependent DNA helicase RecQ